jgi:predicted PurR-regulated permease PerM
MRERLLRERLFFFILVAILLVLTALMIWPFLISILFALAVVVLLKPVYNWFLGTRLVRGRERRASALTVASFVLIIAIPLILIVALAVTQAISLFRSLDLEIVDLSVNSTASTLEQMIQQIGLPGIQFNREEIAEGIQVAITAAASWIGALIISLGQSLPQYFTNGLIVIVVMYVLLPRFNRPGRQDILDLVPFPKEITQLFLDKFNLMIVAMFKGIFVISVLQGLAMGVVFWIAGVPYVFFLTILCIVLSLVPVIGISLVAWPVGILLIVNGQTWQGVFVILMFVIVIGNIDTVLRPRLVPKEAYLNPALIILSVFGGLQLLGIIGVLYGPVIMILLVTCIDVYSKYLLRDDLQTLVDEGRLDLEELGLRPDEEEVKETEKGIGFVAATMKSLATRFQLNLPEKGEAGGDEISG